MGGEERDSRGRIDSDPFTKSWYTPPHRCDDNFISPSSSSLSSSSSSSQLEQCVLQSAGLWCGRDPWRCSTDASQTRQTAAPVPVPSPAASSYLPLSSAGYTPAAHTFTTRQHWIQRITFTAETNAADTYTAWQRDAERHNTLSARYTQAAHTFTTRQHWIQRTTFTAETNTADTYMA